jgi:hypothetical protein
MLPRHRRLWASFDDEQQHLWFDLRHAAKTLSGCASSVEVEPRDQKVAEGPRVSPDMLVAAWLVDSGIMGAVGPSIVRTAVSVLLPSSYTHLPRQLREYSPSAAKWGVLAALHVLGRILLDVCAGEAEAYCVLRYMASQLLSMSAARRSALWVTLCLFPSPVARVPNSPESRSRSVWTL